MRTADTAPSSTRFSTPILRRLGFRYLYAIDAVTLLGLMAAVMIVRFGLDWPTYPRSHYLAGFAAATGLHMALYYFGGMYEYEQRLGRPPWLPRTTLLTLVAVGAVATVTLLTGRYLMPRGNLVVLACSAPLVVSFNRWLARRVRSRRFGRPRVLLLGATDDVGSARRHLGESELGAGNRRGVRHGGGHRRGGGPDGGYGPAAAVRPAPRRAVPGAVRRVGAPSGGRVPAHHAVGHPAGAAADPPDRGHAVRGRCGPTPCRRAGCGSSGCWTSPICWCWRRWRSR